MKKNGGSAFPHKAFFSWDNLDDEDAPSNGTTLRDYFAAHAIGCFDLNEKEVEMLFEGQKPRHEIVAGFCYALADAMIAEREKTN